MEIVRLEAEHMRDVTRLVNAQIASMPPRWQLSETQVWNILQQDSLWEIHYEGEEPPAWTWVIETVCVVEGEHVLAAARFDYRYDEGKLGMAAGRWLVGEADQPAALGMLVDSLMAKRGDSEVAILVNGRSDFGLGWGGIPMTDSQVMKVLADKGFMPFQKWVVMTAEITQEPPPQPSPASDGGSQKEYSTGQLQSRDRNEDLSDLRWRIDEAHREWDVQIYDGEMMVGECQSWGIPPEFGACAGYEEWMQIEWLGVEEGYQRRGLGRRLMQEQHRYQAARGVKHCLLYTDVDNVAARTLDVSLGFEVVAEVWGWMWKPE